MYYVYILLSYEDFGIYTGCTSNLNRRLKQHKLGLVESTKNRLPFKLIYFEGYLFKNQAFKREKYLKTGWGRYYISKVIGGTKSHLDKDGPLA